MENNKKLIILESLICLFVIIENFVLVPSLTTVYIYYLKPISWFMLSLVIYLQIYKKHTIIQKKDKMFYVLIVLILSTTIYYCLGLILGFYHSPYNLSFIGIIRNIYCYVLILVPIELIRQSIVNISRRKWQKILAVIVMILITINLNSLVNTIINGMRITYIFDTIIPCIVTQVFLNFLVYNCGLISNLIWVMIPKFLEVLLPIQPKLDWFYIFLFTVASCLILFVFLYYSYVNKELAKDVRVGRKKKPVSTLFTMIILFAMLGFFTGMFGVQPTVIASDSMNTYFYRGDIVIIDKNSKYDINSVIQYKHENIKVIHRIIAKKTDEKGKEYFITKGDNNNAQDEWRVYHDQIEGTVCGVIPKIGYIALLFNSATGGLRWKGF